MERFKALLNESKEKFTHSTATLLEYLETVEVNADERGNTESEQIHRESIQELTERVKILLARHG